MVERGDIPACGDVQNGGLLYRLVEYLCGFQYTVLNNVKADAVRDMKKCVAIRPHSVAVRVEGRDAGRKKWNSQSRWIAIGKTTGC